MNYSGKVISNYWIDSHLCNVLETEDEIFLPSNPQIVHPLFWDLFLLWERTQDLLQKLTNIRTLCFFDPLIPTRCSGCTVSKYISWTCMYCWANYSRLWRYRTTGPPGYILYAGRPVQQPYARVDYIPQSDTKNLGYCTLNPEGETPQLKVVHLLLRL